MKRGPVAGWSASRLLLAVAIVASACARSAPDEPPAADAVYEVALAYQAPGSGPSPNFSPKGTQVVLADVSAERHLPAGARRPAKVGTLQVGPDRSAWVRVLATSDADHPADLTRLFFDVNRNDDFADDGPPFEAVPSQREKTGDWWSSFSDIELSVPYAGGHTEPFLVNAWIVRDGDAPPDLLRYSRRSWRAGTVSVNGVSALVAVMDANNDAVYTAGDYWSVLAASTPDAPKAVLSFDEARPAHRMMFVDDEAAGREWVLELREIAPDGRSLSFAVVDRMTTKAMDRAGDDVVAAERSRPRTSEPVAWLHDFDDAAAEAARTGRLLLIDFETDWCGPCKTMDEWIWSDAEVASAITAGYVGVKIDGDLEPSLVERFAVTGYPTMIVLDPAGDESGRAVGYQSSAQMIALLGSQ